MLKHIKSSNIGDLQNLMENLSKWLKTSRKQAGLSQKQLANKAGIALTIIRKIEQGQQNVQLSKLLQLMHLFGYTLKLEKEIKSF